MDLPLQSLQSQNRSGNLVSSFFPGAQSLGTRFTRDQLKSHLQLIFNTQNSKKLIGPLIGMYEEESAFKACGALYTDSDSTIYKAAAPVLDELAGDMRLDVATDL